jgi:thiamine biosynthesis lipoprotein
LSSKKVVNIAAYIFIILIVLFVFLKGKRIEKPAFSEVYSMNTICDIEIYGKEKNAALNKVIEVIQQVNKLVDDFSSESDVYRINENAGIKPVKVSRMTLDMIEKSITIARETNSAFDPAIYPLLKLWGFKNKNYRVPTEENIKNTLDISLVVKDGKVYEDPLEID